MSTVAETVRRRAGTAALLVLGLASQAAAQSPAADSAAIHALSRRFSEAYVRGDVEAMVGLYTADAVIFPERAEMIAGREPIRRYWTLGPGRRITRHSAAPTAIVVDGDHAYDYGTYEIAGENDGEAWGPHRGKYVIVWRREPAGWRMHLDMWNSRPAP